MPAHAENIFDIFEYFWVDHKSKKIFQLFGHHVAPSSLLLKIGILSWNFFGGFFLGKMTSTSFWINFFCLKCPKTFSHFVAKSTVTVYFLGIFDPFLDRKLIQNTLDVIFFLKEITKNNFSSKFQFFCKSNYSFAWWPNIYKKILNLSSTQKYSKVGICINSCVKNVSFTDTRKIDE